MYPLPTRIRVLQRVIPGIAISVESLGPQAAVDIIIRRQHPAQDRVIHAAVHVDQAKLQEMFVARVATEEPGGNGGNGGDVGITPGIGMSFSPPGVKILLYYNVPLVVGQGEDGTQMILVGIIVVRSIGAFYCDNGTKPVASLDIMNP